MDGQDYGYQLKPLIVPAVIFLILYPFVIGGIYFFSKLPVIELKILVGIYAAAAVGILILLSVGKSKRVQIKGHQIVFRSLLGKRIIKPQDIQRVVFYFDKKGHEIARIRTKDEIYYLSELYFPFPELMSDLENFIRMYDLRSNLQSNAGLMD